MSVPVLVEDASGSVEPALSSSTKRRVVTHPGVATLRKKKQKATCFYGSSLERSGVKGQLLKVSRQGSPNKAAPRFGLAVRNDHSA